MEVSESQHSIIKWHPNGCHLLASVVFAFLFVFATPATLLPADLKQTRLQTHGSSDGAYTARVVLQLETRLFTPNPDHNQAAVKTGGARLGALWHRSDLRHLLAHENNLQVSSRWRSGSNAALMDMKQPPHPPRLPSASPCCRGSVRSRQVWGAGISVPV